MRRMARGRRRPLPSRVRAAVRATVAFLFSNVGVVGLVIGYTIAGAFMFQAIEGASEMERAGLMVRDRDRTVEYLWYNISVGMNPLNETAIKHRVSDTLRHYQLRVVLAARRGWDGGRGSRQWTFSNAFLYSMTVITTIGYGHLSPRTAAGKLATMLYALLGMPLFLLYLSNVGSLLARWFKCVYSLLCLCRGCPGFRRRRALAHNQQLEISEPESIERPLGWRRHSNSDVSLNYYNEYRNPQRQPRSRYSPDGDIPYRIRPQFNHMDQRNNLDTRRIDNISRGLPDKRNMSHSIRINRPVDHRRPSTRYWDHWDQTLEPYERNRRVDTFPSNRMQRIHDLRNIRHSHRFKIEHRFTPDFRDRDFQRFQQNPKKDRNINGAYFYPEDFRKVPRCRQRREEEWYEMVPRKLVDRRFRDARSMPHPNIHAQRRSNPPLRATTAPPLGPSSGSDSSAFSYVSYDPQTITVPISVCVGILVGYLLFGSMLFGLWEQWDLLDGAYFCFISLTSIGFGDLVPGERVYSARLQAPFVACSLYLMLGMALVAMCFNLMQEQVIHYFAALKRAACRIFRCHRTH